MNGNPYQAPATGSLQETVSPRGLRYKHLRKEADIKALGNLFLLAAFGCGIGGALTLQLAGSSASNNRPLPEILRLLGPSVLLLAITAALVTVSWGLRRLHPWARIAGIVIPIATILLLTCFDPTALLVSIPLSAHVLMTLCGRSASTVFSPAYQIAISSTPDLKCKTAMHTWILIGLLTVAIVVLLAAFIALLEFGP